MDFTRLRILACVLPLVLGACDGGVQGDPERGRQLFQQEEIGQSDAPGCTTCHSLESGEELVGPSLAGVASRAEARIEKPDYTGEATSVEGYLRESILSPNAHVVQGFAPGVMYQEFDDVLTEQDVDDLVAFLLTLE